MGCRAIQAAAASPLRIRPPAIPFMAIKPIPTFGTCPPAPVPGPGQVAVWELERGVQPGVNGLMGHGQPVIGDGDMANLALGLGLQGGIIQAILAAGLGAEGGVMELVNVNVVGAQVPQAGFQVLL